MEKYLNDLINQKQNIVNILTSYGVSATTNERLNTLIPKLRSCVEYANAIQKTAKGNPIAIGDVSSTQHNLQVTVKSKNLISTDNIEVSGTGTWTSKILTKQPLPNGTYTFSCEYENLTENITTIGIVIRDIDEKWISETYGNNGTIKLTFSTTNGISIYLYSNMGSLSTFTDIIFKNIQLEEGSTATAYTPYRTEFNDIEVSRYGKNLFDINSYTNKMCIDISKFNVGDNISISTENNYNFKIANTSGATPLWQGANVNKSTITLTQTLKDCGKLFIVNRTTWITETKDNLISQQVQLELGSTVTEYEPYKEPQTATANSEGVVEGLTSISPNMTLISSTEGIVIDCTYNADTKTYIDNKALALQTVMVGG